MTDQATPFHHGSHRGLLRSPADPSPAGPGGIDAIIVPTARRPAYLDEVSELARGLRCPLVTLHSGKWTSASRAASYLPPDIELIAIDLPEAHCLHLPDWETSRLLAGTIFARKSDLSTKRNLALMLCHLLDWSRVLFLDDDITELDPAHVTTASRLLDTYNAVGLHVDGFPDNSVVCHAYRQAGGRQSSFVGGGALVAEVRRCNSFFPDIYNDDWFYLLDGDKRLQPTVVSGKVRQNPYDPFRTPERARAEELGDVLAEGLYWLLDQDRSIVEADREHWVEFLAWRKVFIENVLEMVRDDDLGAAEKARRIEALKGALGRLTHITPELCAGYLHAWIADRTRWQEHLRLLPVGVELHRAVALLARAGAPRLTWHTRKRAKRAGAPVGAAPVAAAPAGAVPFETAPAGAVPFETAPAGAVPAGAVPAEPLADVLAVMPGRVLSRT
ncbi:MAG TPA: hypothetical protein VF834_04315 [Streptosporangiaceae bacterium]